MKKSWIIKYIFKYVWPFHVHQVLKDIPKENIFSKISSSFYLIFVENRHYHNHILVTNEKFIVEMKLMMKVTSRIML